MSENRGSIKSTCETKLRNLAKFAKSYVLKCPNDNCEEGKVQWYNDDKYDWLLRLECSKCNVKWAICKNCVNFQVGLTSKRQINMHKNTYHSLNRNNLQNINKKKRKNVLEKIDDFISKRENRKKMKKMTTNDDDNESIFSNDTISSSSTKSLSATSTNNIENFKNNDLINENIIQINDDHDGEDNGTDGKIILGVNY
jgi:hypothetical protein